MILLPQSRLNNSKRCIYCAFSSLSFEVVLCSANPYDKQCSVQFLTLYHLLSGFRFIDGLLADCFNSDSIARINAPVNTNVFNPTTHVRDHLPAYDLSPALNT